jgi:hypothetical protein
MTAAAAGTNPTKKEQEHVSELINKMVELKILKKIIILMMEFDSLKSLISIWVK